MRASSVLPVAMGESRSWELRRYVILLVVVGVHAALVAAWLLTSAARGPVATTPQVVELLFLPPMSIPKIRSDSFHPKRLSGDAVASMAPPLLDSGSSSAPTSGADGVGSGVDWSAEARRALQAFEIRSSRPASNHFNSGLPAEERWWPRTRHQAGERFKTPAGDWIVWLNSNCYQIASAAAPATLLPKTTCLDESTGPGDRGQQSVAGKRASGED